MRHSGRRLHMLIRQQPWAATLFEVFLLRQKKTKKTPQSSQPVTLMLNSTPTVQECRTHAGWLVVNHCFQVIHFLSPCKTKVQIFKTSATTAMLSRVSEFTARETTCTAVRTPVEAGTGSGDGAMVQNAALGFFELTVWSEVWFTAGMFFILLVQQDSWASLDLASPPCVRNSTVLILITHDGLTNS